MTGDWDRARSILCVRLDTLGDVLMTSPALRALRSALPRRRITLLTSPAGAAAGELVPEVDEVLVYEAPWMKATPRRTSAAPDGAMVETLRRRSFDAAVIFTVYSQNPLPAALLLHLAGVPLRLAHCRENPYQLLSDWVRELEPEHGLRHEVRRHLDLVASVGVGLPASGSFCDDPLDLLRADWSAVPEEERLSLAVSAEAERSVGRLLGEYEVDAGSRWLVLHPGASASSRRYPPKRFAQIARRLHEEDGFTVLFTGDERETRLVEQVRAAAGEPGPSLAGHLDLAGLAALLARAPLLISNNTGPVHVAAAVGTPVVDVYALTNPQHAPWGVPARVLFHDVPCRFCYRSVCPVGHHRCLRGVKVEPVLAAARELLGHPAPLTATAPP